MDRHAQIDVLSLAAHRVALDRLHEASPMTWEQMAHVLRASAAITQDTSFELPRLVERLQALDAGHHDIKRLVAWAMRRGEEAKS